LVTETLLCLKHQLLGALSGLGQFAHGTMIRPLGFRAADLLMQEYEGTVTIYPKWSLWELFSFLSNFNQVRAG
jgi:TAG lipase/steryl ester hydrolase/phospholipase A2/LPA acyltransferase